MDKLRERSQLGDFCTQFDLLDTSANSKKKKHKDSKDSNPDKPYRKKRSRYRSKEERDARKAFLSEEGIDLLDLSDSNQHGNTCNTCHGDICSCENDEFYKIQSQFEDLNINTITSDNVIELLKEVTDNDLREKIIHLAASNNASSSFSKNSEIQKNDFEFEYSAPYSLSVINNRLNKQTVHTRDSSFDDLKNEIENLKIEIKSLKQNQMIYDHRLTQIETVNNKRKNIVEENTLAKSFNLDPKQGMFLGMMQIVTAHKWLKKDHKSLWTDSHSTLVKDIKLRVQSLPCLTLAKIAWQKVIETYASNIGYGGILK
uniref:Zinc knuckle family protein n=1 Tax=Solanum tuberosum TaxID=4113 RepID=M1DIL5_SOLTU